MLGVGALRLYYKRVRFLPQGLWRLGLQVKREQSALSIVA